MTSPSTIVRRWIHHGRVLYERFFTTSRIPAAVVVGLLTGAIALGLKSLVHATNVLIQDLIRVTGAPWLFLISPGLGVMLTVILVRHVVKADLGHGVSQVLKALNTDEGRLPRVHTWGSLAASTLTVGFGASLGLEAPIVLTGAALGSLAADLLGHEGQDRQLLVLCGAAAAVSGIFKAPVAGVLFVFEVLFASLSMPTLVPVLVASLSATVASQVLGGSQLAFPDAVISVFSPAHIPWYLVLGLLTGLFGLMLVRGLRGLERFFAQKRTLGRLVWGIVLTSLGIYLMPGLFGEGYDSLGEMLQGRTDLVGSWFLGGRFSTEAWFLPLFLMVLLGGKILAVGAASGSGGVGGVFAPSLFSGGVIGMILWRTLDLLGIHGPSEATLILVGMAGVMAAIMHAPLSASFLIAEVTAGYPMLVPLLMSNALAYWLYSRFEKVSVYAAPLEATHILKTHDPDVSALRTLRLSRCITRDLPELSPGMTVRQALTKIRGSRHTVFPVLRKGRFMGVLDTGDLRPFLESLAGQDQESIDGWIKVPAVSIGPMELPETVNQLFEETGATWLPVLSGAGDADEPPRWEGMVFYVRFLKAYRQAVRGLHRKDPDEGMGMDVPGS